MWIQFLPTLTAMLLHSVQTSQIICQPCLVPVPPHSSSHKRKLKYPPASPGGLCCGSCSPLLPTDPDPASLVRVISFLWLPLSSAPPLPHCCLAASVLHKLPSLKWEEGWKRCPLLKAECCGKQTFSPRAQQQQLSASVLMMNHPGLRVDQSAGLMCYVAECRGDGSTCSIMDLRPNLTSASVT